MVTTLREYLDAVAVARSADGLTTWERWADYKQRKTRER